MRPVDREEAVTAERRSPYLEVGMHGRSAVKPGKKYSKRVLLGKGGAGVKFGHDWVPSWPGRPICKNCGMPSFVVEAERCPA